MTEIDTTTEASLPAKRPEVIAALTLHSGPLPPPETVERYEAVLSGSFDRILTMVEQEQQNNFEQNRSGWFFANRGQLFGFVIVVIIVLLYFAILGLTVWFNNTTMFGVIAGAGVIASLPSLVRSFQKKQEKS
jgi:uncharacterized membrane protein